MQTWGGAILHQLYNTSSATEALYGADGQNTSLSVNFVATKNGFSYPLDLLVLDSESTNGSAEYIEFTTNGEGWKIVETYNGGGVWTGIGTNVVKTTNTEIPGANTIFHSIGATQVDINISAGGRQAFAFGTWLKCDTDNDGIVNYLDIDSDNDGITDLIESQGNTYIPPSGNDIDNDGLDDAYDNNTGSTDPTLSAGITAVNTDGTGNPDFLDIDADDDGIPDNIEGQITASYVPPSGTDADGDGLDDAYDNNNSSHDPILSAGISPVNTDGTDNVDYLDLDSDNDGILDIQENSDTDNTLSGTDTDDDGLDDNFDTDNVNWDVNDNINDPNPSTLGDEDNDVDANGNNAIPFSGDVDYRDATEICNNGIDDNGNGDIDCNDSDCGQVTISNVTVGTCINHPYADVATLDVTVTWTATINEKIEVTIDNKTEYIDVPGGTTSPATVSFVVPADGSSNNSITANFTGYTCQGTTTYTAASPCSNNGLTCSILYLCGDFKGADADAFDHGCNILME